MIEKKETGAVMIEKKETGAVMQEKKKVVVGIGPFTSFSKKRFESAVESHEPRNSLVNFVASAYTVGVISEQYTVELIGDTCALILNGRRIHIHTDQAVEKNYIYAVPKDINTLEGCKLLELGDDELLTAFGEALID